jgi:hypothetical protein
MFKIKLERKAPDLIELYSNSNYVGEFIMDVDGFYRYFPTKIDGSTTAGGMCEELLQEIVNHLTKINEEWRNNIYNFFKTQKPVEIQENFNF